MVYHQPGGDHNPGSVHDPDAPDGGPAGKQTPSNCSTPATTAGAPPGGQNQGMGGLNSGEAAGENFLSDFKEEFKEEGGKTLTSTTLFLVNKGYGLSGIFPIGLKILPKIRVSISGFFCTHSTPFMFPGFLEN